MKTLNVGNASKRRQKSIDKYRMGQKTGLFLEVCNSHIYIGIE